MRVSTHWPPVWMVPKPLRGPSHSYRRGVYNTIAGFTGPALGAGAMVGGVELYNKSKPKAKQIKLIPSAEAAKRRAYEKVRKSYPFGKGPEDAIPANQLTPEQKAKYRDGLRRRAGEPPWAPPKKQKALPELPDRGRKVKPVKTKDPKGAYRLQRKIARADHAKEAAKQAEARAAAVERKANAVELKKRPFIRNAQVSSMVTKPMVIAGSAAYLKHRQDQRKRGEKPAGGKIVDAAIGAGAGATATDLGMIAGGWSTKRGLQHHREKKMAEWKATGNPRYEESNRLWEEHKKKWGFKQLAENHPGDRVDATSGPVQQRIMREYPKGMPGWRGQRALAWKNHTAVGPIVGLAGAVGGGALALKAAQQKKVSKKDMTRKESLNHSRKVQGALSLGTASIGLAALGTKGGSMAAKKLIKLPVSGPMRKPLYAKLNDTSIGLTTLGAGLGGASGIHFYRLMQKEAGVKKRDERADHWDYEKQARESNRFAPIDPDFTPRQKPAAVKPAMKLLPSSGGMNVEGRRQKRMKIEENASVAAAGGLAGGAAAMVRPKAIKDAVQNKTVIRSLNSKGVKVGAGLAAGSAVAAGTAVGVNRMRKKQGREYTDWWDG